VAPSVLTSWSGSYCPPLTPPGTGTTPAPGCQGLGITVAMPAGDWAVALVSWRQPPNSPAVTIASVADDAHSWWEPLGAPSAVSSPSGVTRSVAWFCPRSRASALVQAEPTGFVLSMAMTVLDIGGMTDWIAQVLPVTGYANAATSLAMTSAAPGASAILLASCGSDLLSGGNASQVTGPGAGWTTLTPVVAFNGTDHTSDLALNAAWQVASAAKTATWSASPAMDLSGVLGGLIAAPAALAQPNPSWPVMIPEIAVGDGQYTTADSQNWVPAVAPVLDFAFTQGRQYEQQALATGDGVLTLDNPAGAVLPPAFPSSAGVDSGTPARIRCYWPGGAWQVRFSGNGSGAGPFVNSASAFAAPGQVWTQSAWGACSPAWAAGMNLVVIFQDGGFATLATYTSGLAAGPVPAEMAVTTGPAPAGTQYAAFYLQANGTPPAATVFSASAAPVPPGPPGPGIVYPLGPWNTTFSTATILSQSAWSANALGPPNPTPWYVPFSGFVERLPQQWDETWRGFTAATITDMWTSLQENMQPILPAEMLADAPQSVWPCTDLPGSLVASNLAPGNSNPMFVRAAKSGVPSLTQAFGANAGALPGAQGTFLINPQYRISSQAGMWSATQPASGVNTVGFSLTAVDSGFPSPAGGATIECWFQVTANFSTTTDPFIISVTDIRSCGFAISVIYLSGNLVIWRDGGSPVGNVATLIDSSVNYNAAGSPLTHIAVTYNSTTFTVYLNGVAKVSGSWSTPLHRDLPYLCVNGVAGTAMESNTQVQGDSVFWAGYAGQVAIFPRILHPLRILTHYEAALTGMAGDQASQRVERILGASTDAVFRRLIMQETRMGLGGGLDQVASCTDLPGSPAGQGITNIAGSVTPGQTFVTPGGELFMLSKQAAWGQPARWTLGSNVSAGEIPFTDSASLGYDPAKVANAIQFTQLDRQDIVTSQVPAITNASEAQYGSVTINATGYLFADATTSIGSGPGLYDLANWLATTYQAPLMRGEVITIDAAANPAAWPVVLGASVADMVQVNTRPPTGGGLVIPITGRVSQTTRRLVSGDKGITEGSLQLIIDAAPEAEILTCDSPTLGLLDGTHILGW